MSSHDNNTRAPEILTGYPGHVYNFDPESQTCEVQLALESLFIGYSEAYSLKIPDRLQKVPVQFMQGGGWSLTYDIPDGTPCYVHFAHRGFDHWLFENKDTAGLVGGKPAPAFSQLFHHESATCIIGLQPIPKAIPGFTTGVCELRNADRSQRVSLYKNGGIDIIAGSATVKITKDSEIEISVTSKATIKAPQIILDGATTVTKSLTVQGGMDISGTLPSGETSKIAGNFAITGNTTQTGSFTLNGIPVDTHKHPNPEGGDVGPMKA